MNCPDCDRQMHNLECACGWRCPKPQPRKKMESERPPDPPVKWDPNDDKLIKGLLIWGVDSEFFKSAPKECQEAALRILKGGWRAKNKTLEVAVKQIGDNIEK